MSFLSPEWQPAPETLKTHIADLAGDPKNETGTTSHILIAVKRCSNDVENFIKGRPIIDNICFINAAQEEFPDGHIVVETNINKNNIGTNFHYPVPAHLQKPYINLGYKKGDFPVTETIANSQLSIPIFPEMKKNEIDYVIKIINN